MLLYTHSLPIYSYIPDLIINYVQTDYNMSPARENSGIHESLLPEIKYPAEDVLGNKSASVSGAVFNVSTTIIGAGIMSIPATIKVLGVLPALVLITVVALLVDVSVEFLLRFTYSGEAMTYAGVMKESFGRAGAVGVQICVLVTNLGCLIVYLIIIGDVLSGNESEGSVHLGVLQEWFGFQWWNTRPFALIFILIFLILPLVLLRRVESLRFSSAVSVLLAVVFVAICSVMAISAVVQGKSKRPKLLPDLGNNAGSFLQVFTAVPVIVTAFTFHFNVHPIGVELDKPSHMIYAVRISLVLCAAIYFTIGIFGYLMFGNEIMPDILINFGRASDSALGSLLNDTVRLTYALHLILVFPLLNFSLRANIDELLFPKKPLEAAHRTRFLVLTFFLLAFSYLAAIAIPNIWYFFQYVGSTAAVLLAFIFPGAIVLRDVHGVSTKKDRIVAAIMIVLAVVTSSMAISANIYPLTGNNT